VGEVAAYALTSQEGADRAVGGQARAGDVFELVVHPPGDRRQQGVPLEGAELGCGSGGEHVGLAVAAGPQEGHQVDGRGRVELPLPGDGGLIVEGHRPRPALDAVQPAAVVVGELDELGRVERLTARGDHDLLVQLGAARRHHRAEDERGRTGHRETEMGGDVALHPVSRAQPPTRPGW